VSALYVTLHAHPAAQVYRLITRKTYEAVMFERASRKLGLEQAVLCQARDKGPSTVRPAAVVIALSLCAVSHGASSCC
jgi:hypothetical protein